MIFFKSDQNKETQEKEKIELETILNWPKIKAKKIGLVQARIAKEGEVVYTYTSDGILETTNTARAGDYIVMRCNADGTVFVDSHGNTNTWIIRKATFEGTYKQIDGSLYEPASKERTFVIVQEDLEFVASWGEKMLAYMGDYLNVTDLEDVIRVGKEEFLNTYRVTKE